MEVSNGTSPKNNLPPANDIISILNIIFITTLRKVKQMVLAYLQFLAIDLDRN